MKTTALSPGETLELVVQLCCVQLPDLTAVHLQTKKLSGTIQMAVKYRIIKTYHIIGLETTQIFEE